MDLEDLHMIEKDLIFKVEEVAEELDKLEKHYRLEGNKAFEIDDQKKFQEIQLNTYSKVQEIKRWKTKVEDLKASISRTEISEEEYKPIKQETHDFNEPKIIEAAPEPKPEPKPAVEAIPEPEPEPEPIFEPEPVVEETTKIQEQPIEEPTPESKQISPPKEDPRLRHEIVGKELEEEIIERNPKTVITLTLFGAEHSLKYWSAVLIKVCEELLMRKPYVVSKLDKNKTLDNVNNSNFSYTKSDIIRSPKRLHNGLWIELDRTCYEVLRIVNTLMRLGGYSEEDITVKYK